MKYSPSLSQINDSFKISFQLAPEKYLFLINPIVIKFLPWGFEQLIFIVNKRCKKVYMLVNFINKKKIEETFGGFFVLPIFNENLRFMEIC